MMGIFVACCVSLSALLLLFRRNMSEGKMGFHKKSRFYRWGLDAFAFCLTVRAYTAWTNGARFDWGVVVLSICTVIFCIALIYEAWRKESPPPWWPYAKVKDDRA